MAMKTLPFDAADLIETPEDVAVFLNDAFQSGEAGEILDALRTVARSRGMTGVAEATGLSRQTLYKALGEDGNPALSTLLKIMDALGYDLAAVKRAAGKAA